MTNPPRVVALYRYPVKGFTPEACPSLTVLAEGRIAGDRVLAFRLADADAADAAWSRKQQCVVLMNTPGLARLDVRFDPRVQRLCIRLDGATLVDEAIDDNGRRRLAAALASYVLKLAERVRSPATRNGCPCGSSGMALRPATRTTRAGTPRCTAARACPRSPWPWTTPRSTRRASAQTS